MIKPPNRSIIDLFGGFVCDITRLYTTDKTAPPKVEFI